MIHYHQNLMSLSVDVPWRMSFPNSKRDLMRFWREEAHFFCIQFGVQHHQLAKANVKKALHMSRKFGITT